LGKHVDRSPEVDGRVDASLLCEASAALSLLMIVVEHGDHERGDCTPTFICLRREALRSAGEKRLRLVDLPASREDEAPSANSNTTRSGRRRSRLERIEAAEHGSDVELALDDGGEVLTCSSACLSRIDESGERGGADDQRDQGPALPREHHGANDCGQHSKAQQKCEQRLQDRAELRAELARVARAVDGKWRRCEPPRRRGGDCASRARGWLW
jgi:hypothetical protein